MKHMQTVSPDVVESTPFTVTLTWDPATNQGRVRARSRRDGKHSRARGHKRRIEMALRIENRDSWSRQVGGWMLLAAKAPESGVEGRFETAAPRFYAPRKLETPGHARSWSPVRFYIPCLGHASSDAEHRHPPPPLEGVKSMVRLCL